MAGESHWIIGIPTVWIAVINIVISVLLISPSFGPKVVNAKHPWANKGPFHLLRRHWDPQWSHPQRVVGSIFRKADVCIYIYIYIQYIIYIYIRFNQWNLDVLSSEFGRNRDTKTSSPQVVTRPGFRWPIVHNWTGSYPQKDDSGTNVKNMYTVILYWIKLICIIWCYSSIELDYIYIFYVIVLSQIVMLQPSYQISPHRRLVTGWTPSPASSTSTSISSACTA